jgi:Domain of unknown function (DUF4234)
MNYGDTYTPTGASAPVKLRGPLWVGVLSLLTLGIYSIYWVYESAKHLRDYGRAHDRDLGQRPGMTLLAMTAGWLVIVPPFVAMYRQARRIQQAQQLAGTPVQNGWLALVLYVVVTPAYFAYEQAELNNAWAADGAPVPTSFTEAPPLAA